VKKAAEDVDIITPHITDAHSLDVPWFAPPFYKEVELPQWQPIKIGSLEVDISPTKHVVFLLFAGILRRCCSLVRRVRTRGKYGETGTPKGFAAAIEATVLYLRNEIILPNVGPHGNGFVPFCLTIFFSFSLETCSVCSRGARRRPATSPSPRRSLIVSFLVIEIAGMREQGLGYLNTIFYWPHTCTSA